MPSRKGLAVDFKPSKQVVNPMINDMRCYEAFVTDTSGQLQTATHAAEVYSREGIRRTEMAIAG